MTALIKYEAARYALKIAQQVDEVKDIRDKAQALAAYARQAKDMDMINWATEIKLRAERRVGELLNGAEKNTGAAGIGTSAVTRGDRTPPTLAEVGLTKRQSSDFQAIATIPEAEFEEEVKKPKTTTKSLVRASPKRKEKAKKEPKSPKPKKEKAKPEDNGDDELANELIAADKEIRSLNDLVASLKKSDLAAEVVKWRENFTKLEARLQQCIATKAEAEKQAKYSTGLLAKIRKILKVEKNTEIIPALEAR